jgi:MFS family permease
MLTKSFENLFYVMTVFLNMDVQRSLFVLYLLQVGLSHGKIGILQSILFFANVALEVPSGLLADRYGRRVALFSGFIGLVLNGIGFLLFTSFLPFAILFCVYGFSLAMSSGSDRALLYDNLVATGREGEYAKILSRVRSVGALSVGASMLAGGLLYETWSWNGVYIIFAVSKLIGAILVVFLPEFKINKTTQGETVSAQKEPTNKEPADRENTTEGTRQPSNVRLIIKFFLSVKGRTLLPLFVGYGLFESATIPLYIYAQDLFANKGLSIPVIAAVYTGVEIITAGMFVMAGTVANRWPLGRISCVTTVVITGLLFILSLKTEPVITIGVFLLIMSLPAFYETSYETYINNNIESQIRASCLSVSNLIISVLIGISYTVFGGILDQYSFSTALIIVAVVCLFGFGGVVISLTRRNDDFTPLEKGKTVQR